MKKFTALLLIFALFLPQTIFANESAPELAIKDLALYESEHVSGVLPLFQGDEAVTYQLNKIVEYIYESTVAELGENQNVIFSYEVIESGAFTSVLMHTDMHGYGTSEQRINTFVLKTSDFSLMTLEDLLGVNAYKLANGVIARQIASAEEGMFFTGENAFRGLVEDPSFYLDADGNVVIIFNKYTIAPGAAGMPTFKIPLDRVINFEVTAEDIFVQDGVTFVRLLPAKEALGYTLTWDGDTRQVTISMGEQSHVLTIGSRQFNGRELVAAPIIRNDHTFVPVSFFELTPQTYYLVEDDMVTISAIR